MTKFKLIRKLNRLETKLSKTDKDDTIMVFVVIIFFVVIGWFVWL